MLSNNSNIINMTSVNNSKAYSVKKTSNVENNSRDFKNLFDNAKKHNSNDKELGNFQDRVEHYQNIDLKEYNRTNDFIKNEHHNKVKDAGDYEKKSVNDEKEEEEPKTSISSNEELLLLQQNIMKFMEALNDGSFNLTLEGVNTEQLKAMKEELIAALNNKSGDLNKLLMAELEKMGLQPVEAEELIPSIVKDIEEIIKGLQIDQQGLGEGIKDNSKTSNLMQQLSNEVSKKIITEAKEQLNTKNNMLQGETNINNTVNKLSETMTNSEGNASGNDSFTDKEHKILSNLVNEEDQSDKNINRTVSFMNQLMEAKEVDSIKSVDNITVNRNNFTADIVKAVKFMEINDMKALTIKIMPKELGEVVINVTMESGVMKAQLSAANKDTMNLLHAHLQDINDKLNSSDIKIQNVTIDIYQDDTTFFSDQFNRNNDSRNNNQSNKSKNKSIEEIQGDESSEDFVEVDGNVNTLA